MITIVSATNRPDPNSIIIAEKYQEVLTRQDEKTQIIDLRELPETFVFSALYENIGKNEAFNAIIAKMRLSDKFVFVVPEYNGSFPGVLKAFIDGMNYPSPFRGKKGALVGLGSGTMGGALALSHLTDIFNYLGMHVLANKVRFPKIENILENGQIQDKFMSDLLEAQAGQLIRF